MRPRSKHVTSDEQYKQRVIEVTRLDGCEHDWLTGGGMCCSKCRRNVREFVFEVMHPELPRETYRDELRERTRLQSMVLPPVSDSEWQQDVSVMVGQQRPGVSFRVPAVLRILGDECDIPTVVEGKE